MTRAEKVARAQALRARGLTILQIAERMGVARSTAGAYLSDPVLFKQRGRRSRYARPCADHPEGSVVGRRMGWNNALLRAGFALRCDRRPETQEWIEAQIRAGRPTAEIADALGVSPNNIHERMRTRGMRVSELRRAA